MPQAALDILQETLPVRTKKLRYYQELDGSHMSYEAKFRYHRRPFSVEFDKYGVLEDVEVGMDFNTLSVETRNNIKKYLEKECETFKVLKCQKQFKHIGDNPQRTLNNALHNKESDNIFYELEADLRMEKGWSSYEILFDESGRFISKRRIVNQPLDNLLY